MTSQVKRVIKSGAREPIRQPYDQDELSPSDVLCAQNWWPGRAGNRERGAWRKVGGGGDGGELRPGGEGGEAVAAIACRDSGVALTLIPARGDVAVVATTCAAAATQINRPSPHRPAPRPQHSKLEHLSREKIAMLLPHSHCFASLKGSRSSHM